MPTNTKSREYELQITRDATHITDAELQELRRTLENPNAGRADRLNAYCVIFTYHRRHREIRKCIEIYEKYRAEFGNEFIALHLLSIAQRDSGKRKDLLSPGIPHLSGVNAALRSRQAGSSVASRALAAPSSGSIAPGSPRRRATGMELRG